MGIFSKFAKLSLGTVGALYVTNAAFPSKYSTTFFGKTKECAEFEKQLDKELPFSLKEIADLTFENVIKSVLLSKYMNAERSAEEIIKKYPKLHLGYSLLASHHQLHQNRSLAKRYLGYAKEVAEKYPEENELLGVPLLTQDENDDKLWPVTQTEVIPERIYHFRGPFVTKHGRPLDVGATVAKMKDGSVCIVNPITFNEENIRFISSLGPVKSVFSPCMGHDECWKAAMSIWPEATFYHVKDFKPPENLSSPPKVVVLKDGENPFSDDFVVKRFKGQAFQETVLYEPETHTLLGLTDLAIPTSGSKNPFGFGVYGVMMGLLRGPKHTTPLAFQNYNHLFVTSLPTFRQSLKNILAQDIHHAPHGHGGIIEGKFTSNVLAKTYTDILDESFSPSPLDRFFLACSYFSRVYWTRDVREWFNKPKN